MKQDFGILSPQKNKTSVRYVLEHGWYFSGLYNSSVDAISAALVKSAAGNVDFVQL